MAQDVHFTSDVFAFLRALTRNNEREWFHANKARYERSVRDPFLRFIADVAPHLRKVSPHFVADPKPVGGSMFRIYRDTRFSRDKRPYKTVAAAQFRHERGKDVHAPGFYVHLEPGNVFAGVGLWHPDSTTLRAIRDGIVERPTAWNRAVTAKRFREHFTLAGDVLKRPPRGYDAEHPLIDDLKRRDFIATTAFEDGDVLGPGFLERYIVTLRAAKPFMAFLTRALGLPF
jgi:uncharacterized protein (TIGR02453 family)